MDKTIFTDLYPQFDRHAGPKYQPLRQAARERFALVPLPTTRTEDWRFTNIAPLLETAYQLPQGELTIDLKLLPARPTPDTIRLVFANGRYAMELSSLKTVPPEVQVGSLVDARPDRLPIAQIATDMDNVFAALNTSFLREGACIVIPDGKVVEPTIEIIHLSRPETRPVVTHPRVLIVAGKNAQATIVERYVGEGAYFTNAVTEIALAEHAIVDHVKVQQESGSAYHVATTQVAQGARSTFSTHYLSLGGLLTRNEVRVRFDGEHAEATVNGLYLAGGKQHVDNFTVIDHAQPNCASHELYKGILNDRAHGVFNGKIFVRKDAQKTDAKQTNKVLLLSDDATINTKPQLEIFADDVKCTHGATIGQLDEAQLFYLQSRGIPLNAARRLLTFAFANDVVGRVKIEAIRQELEARIVR
jgi:Fe-S cluster assembly protein SufD